MIIWLVFADELDETEKLELTSMLGDENIVYITTFYNDITL